MLDVEVCGEELMVEVVEWELTLDVVVREDVAPILVECEPTDDCCPLVAVFETILFPADAWWL